MKFKHKITGQTVVIKTGDQDHVWYTKEGDKTLLLLQADIFFIEYESVRSSKEKRENK